jgi:methionyl-tRNA formyltransferase
MLRLLPHAQLAILPATDHMRLVKQPDLLLSVHFNQRLGSEVLALPPRGALNVHGALLPRNRGLFPHFWALANGDSETGVTVHWMDERLDHGDVLLQRTVAIAPHDTVHALVLRSKVDVGRHALLEALERIERETRQDLSRASLHLPRRGRGARVPRSRGTFI